MFWQAWSETHFCEAPDKPVIEFLYEIVGKPEWGLPDKRVLHQPHRIGFGSFRAQQITNQMAVRWFEKQTLDWQIHWKGADTS